jgi:putative ABC transport system permease protein
MWDGFYTYVLLHENTSAKALEAKLPDFVQQKVGEQLKSFQAAMVFTLMPVMDIHLDSDFIGEFKSNGSRDSVYFLGVVALLIIVIAWINYINLSTTKSVERAREVGVRKVMGGFRQQLIQQFLIESLALNLTASVVAIAVVLLITPWFGQVVGRELGYELFLSPSFWLWALIVLLGGALLSGVYPAFVLSSFKPIDVLKGRFKNSGKGVLLRKGMVVAQFVASVTLMVGTFTVYQQLHFMRTQALGVQIDQTVVLPSPTLSDSLYTKKYEVFKNRLLNYPEVTGVCASTSIPGSSPNWNAGGIRRLSQREDEQKQYRVILVDHDFVSLYGLEIIAGRKFSGENAHEEKTVLLNEAAVRHMGFEKMDEAIDDHIFFWGDTFRIVGVLKNYRQESLKKAFEPLIFRYGKSPEGFYSIKFKTAAVQKSLHRFENDWKELFPGNPFNYYFLDDHYNQQYKADQQFGMVFGIFSGLAIFVACLGLFGLSSLNAVQRTKEIGVRKVMGASSTSILILVGRDYMVLLTLAIAIATPCASWVMGQWLQAFASPIALSWWIYAVPCVIVVIIALLTVSLHTWMVARTNPVTALRYE